MNENPETVTFALDCAACGRRSFVTALSVHFGPPHYCPWCREETYRYRPLGPEDLSLSGPSRDFLEERFKYALPRQQGRR